MKRIFNTLKQINLKDVYRALTRKDSPTYVKAILIGAIIYLISPIDVIPDFLGPLGWVDDIAIVTGLVTFAMNLLDKADTQATFGDSTSTETTANGRIDVTNSADKE